MDDKAPLIYLKLSLPLEGIRLENPTLGTQSNRQGIVYFTFSFGR